MSTIKSVKGILINKQNNPLADAVIMITAGSHSFQDMASISNENGEFFLDNLSLPGNYTIQINWEGNIFKETIFLNATDSSFTLRL